MKSKVPTMEKVLDPAGALLQSPKSMSSRWPLRSSKILSGFRSLHVMLSHYTLMHE